jgi:hypothetical protein
MGVMAERKRKPTDALSELLIRLKSKANPPSMADLDAKLERYRPALAWWKSAGLIKLLQPLLAARAGSVRETLADRWVQYQQYLDNAHRKHPNLHYSALTAMTAKYFKVSQRTIRRHTRRPR